MSATQGAPVARWHVPGLVAALVLALASPGSRVGAAPGSFDPSFGTGGIVVTARNGTNVIRELALQDDGRIVALGTTDDQLTDFMLARYEADGTLDPTFGTEGVVQTDFGGNSNAPTAMLLQPDGRIVAAHYSSVTGPSLAYSYGIVRYDTDGSLDTTFGDGGRAVLMTEDYWPRTSSIVRQADGGFVIGGSKPSRTMPYGEDGTLTRFTADGVLDTSWGTNGHVRTVFTGHSSLVAALVVQEDGRLTALAQSHLGDFLLARYRPDGSPDPSFGTGGRVIVDVHNNSGRGLALAIQADGKLVAAGLAEGPLTRLDFYAVRLNPDGSLDPTFDGDGKVILDFGGGRDESAEAVLVDGIGRIILAGTVRPALGEHTDFGLARYNADGSLDTSFGVGGKVIASLSPSDAAHAALLQPDGKIVVGGEAYRRVSNFALARFDGGIPHASAFFLHGGPGLQAGTAPPGSGVLTMRPVAPAAEALTVEAPSVTWLSDPPVNGVYPAGATFRFVTPCTRTSSAGKTVRLASIDVDGGSEQLLGTAQSAQACGRTETIVIPVPTPVTLTNRRLKLTVSAPEGVHLQLGPRTFVSATAFQPQP